MKPTQGERAELQIEGLGVHGEGVGRLRGFTLFVDGALPGERVEVCVEQVKSSFGRARLQRILTSSPHRVSPPCAVFGRCGGCQLMHLDYREQLERKRGRVVDALRRIGKLDVEVQPCLPSPQQLHYRHKIQLPVGREGALGLYARGTHDLVEIEQCHIHSPLGERVLQGIRPLLKRVEGLKHVLIKTAVHTQQVLVVLVTRGREPPLTLAEEILRQSPEIKGVVQNIHPLESNVILGTEWQTLAGQGWFEEMVCGLRFKVSPASFFQVNPAQAELLYTEVVRLAELRGTERVLDAYCGVGTLSLVLAPHAREVVGIECIEEAIVDARENAAQNGVEHAQFICGRAEKEELGEFDLVVLNPPRKGCDPQLLEHLMPKRPSRLLYISCDPATLARDLHLLTQQSYSLQRVQPFDLFPQTMHVESVALLTAKP